MHGNKYIFLSYHLINILFTFCHCCCCLPYSFFFFSFSTAVWGRLSPQLHESHHRPSPTQSAADRAQFSPAVDPLHILIENVGLVGRWPSIGLRVLFQPRRKAATVADVIAIAHLPTTLFPSWKWPWRLINRFALIYDCNLVGPTQLPTLTKTFFDIKHAISLHSNINTMELIFKINCMSPPT